VRSSAVRIDAPRRITILLTAIAALACGDERDAGWRGAGMQPASLPPAERAQVYAAALGASFDLADPGLRLVVNPATLPATGYAPGPVLPPDVVQAMLATNAFRGTCQPRAPSPGRAPVCDAPQAGYVVRVSDVFRARGDTLQTFALSERFDTPASGTHSAFRLEAAYQLVRRGGRWAVARTARITGAE
jgi:hypothetical protein